MNKPIDSVGDADTIVFGTVSYMYSISCKAKGCCNKWRYNHNAPMTARFLVEKAAHEGWKLEGGEPRCPNHE